MNDKRDQHRQREEEEEEPSSSASKCGHKQAVRDAGGREESESPFNYSTVPYVQKTGI